MPEMIDSTDGVRVALHDLGGDGPTLLVLHATGFHGRCYRAIADALAPHFHVWAPDLRGHGDTVTPDIALPWAGMVDDTRAVIDHLVATGRHPAGTAIRACGHSMGGATVLATEARWPGTVEAAWLFEPIVFPPDAPVGPENPMAALARRRRHDFASFDEVVERYSTRPLFAGVDPRVLRDYVEHGFRPDGSGVTLKASGEMEARVFEGVDTTLFERLPTIGIEVTVVASGDNGPPAAVAPRIADRLPHGHLARWPTHSHLGPFQDPERAAAEILAALA